MRHTYHNTLDHPGQELVTVALRLCALGWNPLPLRARDKRPLVRWKKYQGQLMDEEELIKLFEENPEANLGVVTGTVSQLLVLDADAPEIVQKRGIPETPIVETARGRHYYFALPDTRIRSATNIADGLDVKAEGGYVVVPPSVHPSGKRYEWIIPPRGLDTFGAEPAPPPSWLLEMLSKWRARSGTLELSRLVQGVPEGQRNISSAALIGKLLGCLPPDDWESIAWPLACAWNACNSPPLPEKQLRYTFDCIAHKELQKRSQALKQSDLLEKLVNFISSNFSQQQIAKELNVHRSTISRLLKTLKNPSTTSKRTKFETNIANGSRLLSRKLCTEVVN